MQDKDALGIDEVKEFVDLSKAETTKTIKSIKEDSAKFSDQNNSNVIHVFVTIGFLIVSKFTGGISLLTEVEAPLADTTMAHFYSPTTTGEMLNYSQLVADLTSHPSLLALLINEHDGDMEMKAWHIEASHLHADARGKAAFME